MKAFDSKTHGVMVAGVLLVLALFVPGLIPSVPAQTIPVNPKFGSISDAEMDMTSYAPDSSATAVLLYRNLELVIGFDANYEIGRTVLIHDRWKILKEEGRDVANYQQIYSTSAGGKEHVSDIRVVTYNREENGKIRQTKMSRKLIFDERYTDGLNRISFTAEDVHAGSVVEVSYKLESPSVQIDDIYLQSGTYPVNQVKVDVAYAEYFYYNAILRGIWPCTRQRESTNEAVTSSAGTLAYTLFHDIYTAVDVPALREESYLFCPDQYRLSVVYDLRSIVIPGIVSRHYSTQWKDVDDLFAESDLMNQVKARYRDAEALQGRIAGLATEDEKIATIWSQVLGLAKWDGSTRLFPEEPRQTIKKGEGSSADINALMASALNTLGYVAEPVLVKPRSSGNLYDYHIAVSSFRTFILRVTASDGSVRYLDASDRDSWFNVLSPDLLVHKARLLHLDGRGEWVDLSGLDAASSLKESVKLLPDPATGRLSGSAQIDAGGQVAHSIKSHYHEFSSEEAWIEETENDEGIEIRSMSLENPDNLGGKARIAYSFESDCEQSGDFLYIKPFLSQWHSGASFREEDRKLPVEFPYPERITYVCVIEVPEGYVVEHLPENVQVAAGAGQGSFTMQCQAMGRQIQLSFRSRLETMLIPPKDYADFRAYWEALSEAEKQVIILKKQ